MDAGTDNPLSKYFRRPGVHIKLPTGGRFFNADEIELSMTGELAVYPMTAADEITLKNPDMLLNGDALKRLFASCVPGIKEPMKISIPDMDVILLAIKLASYGQDLPVSAECPKCQTKVEVEVDIRPIIETAKEVPENTDVRLDDDIVVTVRPYDFESKVLLDLADFEEKQLFKFLMSQEEMSDVERGKRFNQSFERFASLNLDLIAKCVMQVTTPDGVVTDQGFIREYIRDMDKNLVLKISNTIKSFGEIGIDNQINLKCPSDECKHEWHTDLAFDPSRFFA